MLTSTYQTLAPQLAEQDHRTGVFPPERGSGRNLEAYSQKHVLDPLTQTPEQQYEYCRYVEQTIQSQQVPLDFERIRSHIEYIMLNPAIIKKIVFPKQAVVAQEEVYKYVFSHANFPPVELTVERLTVLFHLISHYFFENDSLYKTLLKASRLFRIAVHESEVGAKSKACAYFEVEEKFNQPNCFVRCDMVFVRSKWGSSAAYRSVDGLSVGTKLKALIATMCHETTHAISILKCGDENHGEKFRKLNSALFGHSSTHEGSVDFMQRA